MTRALTKAECRRISVLLTPEDKRELLRIGLLQQCADAWGDEALFESTMDAARKLGREILNRPQATS
jgi:hypothetical protein